MNVNNGEGWEWTAGGNNQLEIKNSKDKELYRQDYIRPGSDHLKVEEENKKWKRRRMGKVSENAKH